MLSQTSGIAKATLNATDVAQVVPLPPILSSRIPLDVYEEIIDWMDQPTLAAAALVDTAWHTRAVDNLYSTILIDSRTSFDLLVKQARASPRVRRWLAATRRLIVTHIVISRTYWYNRKYATVPGLFLHALPASLAQTMPGLRTLTIGFGLYPFMHPTFFHTLPLFEHVVSLRLLDVWLSNIAQLHRIVYAFPRLESLSLFSGSLKEMYTGARSQSLALLPPNSRHTSNIRPKKLVIDTCGDQHTLERMIDWLVQSEICANLHDLTVKYWWVKPHSEEQHGTSELVNQLLRRSGPHLVRFCEIAGSRQYPGRSDFTDNTILRDLAFPLKAWEQREFADALSERATELLYILTTIRSYQLKRIAITFSIQTTRNITEEDPDIRQIYEMPWPATGNLHAVLRRPHFSALEQVTVRILTRYSGDRGTTEESADIVTRAIVAMYSSLLAPWCDRHIVQILCEASGTIPIRTNAVDIPAEYLYRDPTA